MDAEAVGGALEGRRGRIAWLVESGERLERACAIAGVLAECGVQVIRVQDPRACRSWEIRAREADLPGALVSASVGTTFSCGGVDILIDETELVWIAADEIARGLAQIG